MHPGVPFVLFCPRMRVCQRRWIASFSLQTTLDAGLNVCNSLPLRSHSKPEGLGFRQCSFRHRHLGLTTQRIGSFLLRSRLHMLRSPSSFEGEGKWSVQRTLHQFLQLALRSRSAAEAAHTEKCYDPTCVSDSGASARFQSPCEGIRSARLNLLDAFSQAMISVSSTSSSSS
jgi:hypothetical protein